MNTEKNNESTVGRGDGESSQIPDEAPLDVAERPGDSKVDHDHADELADEWGRESFPGSDPPAHY